MISSLSSSTNYAFSYDYAEEFEAMETEFNKRFEILSRVDSYSGEKSPQLLKMFSRILRHELDAELNRSASEKIFIDTLKHAKLVKSLKKKLTDFSFDCIKKIHPSLSITVEKHYTNLVQLYESYFQSIYKFQYIKRIKLLKSASYANKIELYVCLIELILEYVSTLFKNKLQMLLESITVKAKKSSIDILAIKNEIMKHKERELREIKEKEARYCEIRYKIRLPSLKGGLFADKARDHAISLPKKQRTNPIEVLGFRANRPSCGAEATLQAEVHSLNISQKHKTDTSLYDSPNKRDQIFKHHQFQTCDTQKKTIKLKPLVPECSLIKANKIISKGTNMSVRVLQSKQDFLEQFSFNLSQLSRSLGLQDLEIDDSKPQRRMRHKKQEWLLMNQNKLLNVLVSKHNFISKSMNSYAFRYGKVTQP